MIERGNSELKDNYGARHVRVKGHDKVYTHLMFGVFARTVKWLFNMLNYKYLSCFKKINIGRTGKFETGG